MAKIAPYWPLPDPFDSHIVLADGTEFEGEAGMSDIAEELWLWPKNMSILNAAVTFSDPAKTETITIRQNSGVTAYSGFTELTDVKTNWNGKLSVCMRKPRQTEEIQNGV